jgi:hypothetical protein
MAQPNQSPAQTSRTTAADVFSYLFMFILLYIGVFAFLGLLFDYVDALYPPAFQYFYGPNSIIVSVSTLFVVWPVFILVSWWIGRQQLREPSKRQLGVRKWLVYLTLFAAALTLVIDLVTLVYNFLSGGFSISFGLKTLAVLVVAGAVFGYFLWDLRRSDKKSIVAKLFAWITSIVLVGAIIAGFFIVGTPGEQRDKRYDAQRVQDLQSIQSQVFSFYSQKQQIPQSIAELETDVTGFVVPVDPETKQSYEYIVTGELTFDLCATFASEQKTDQTKPGVGFDSYSIYGPYGPIDGNWDHAAGRVCFDQTIDPALLAPYGLPTL